MWTILTTQYSSWQLMSFFDEMSTYRLSTSPGPSTTLLMPSHDTIMPVNTLVPGIWIESFTPPQDVIGVEKNDFNHCDVKTTAEGVLDVGSPQLQVVNSSQSINPFYHCCIIFFSYKLISYFLQNSLPVNQTNSWHTKLLYHISVTFHQTLLHWECTRSWVRGNSVYGGKTEIGMYMGNPNPNLVTATVTATCPPKWCSSTSIHENSCQKRSYGSTRDM